jgi:hypothetical protein
MSRESAARAANFPRLITLLDLLCFAMLLAHDGSCFALDRTPESKKGWPTTIETLKQRSIEAYWRWKDSINGHSRSTDVAALPLAKWIC